MFLSACRAKCWAKTSCLMVLPPPKTRELTFKIARPSAGNADRPGCSALAVAKVCRGRLRAFGREYQFHADDCCNRAKRNFFKWGLATTPAKGIPQVRRCNFTLPSTAKMPFLPPAISNYCKRLQGGKFPRTVLPA